MNDKDIVNRIIQAEGGFVDHPDDRGGPTNFGITQKTLSAYRRKPATLADVRALTREEAFEIYTEQYIKPFNWIQDERMRYFVINCGVQHGVSWAIKALQTALGVSADGVIGPVTVTARMNHDTFLTLIALRAAHYGDIIFRNSSQRAFAAGWFYRLSKDLRETIRV